MATVTAIEQNTPDVLAEVLSGAKHIDALEVLQEDIDFLKGLTKAFGEKPTKEENAVLAKYHSILDNKCNYLGQLLKNVDVKGTGLGNYEKLTFTDWWSINSSFNITVVISRKEEA